MTALDLAPIKARAAAATEGPWFPETFVQAPVTGTQIPIDKVKIRPVQRTALGSFDRMDGEFIAAARADIPALCDEVERLRKALRDLMEAVDHPMVREVWGMIEDGEGKYSDQLWATLYPWFEIKMNAYRTADALLEATP